jgi:hypothetical protein
MNAITSTPEAINPSVVDAIRHQYKEVSAMVGVHPSILYAQAVLRPSLALAQGHASTVTSILIFIGMKCAVTMLIS